MEFETVPAETFGASLKGYGLNLLVRDVERQVAFLTHVFEMTSHRVSADFAILAYQDQLMQLHADHTYAGHPLLGILPEAGARGAGAEVRLYQTDPDRVAERARVHQGAHILQKPEDKPHGLREVCILCENGYAWVASRPLFMP